MLSTGQDSIHGIRCVRGQSLVRADCLSENKRMSVMKVNLHRGYDNYEVVDQQTTKR